MHPLCNTILREYIGILRDDLVCFFLLFLGTLSPPLLSPSWSIFLCIYRLIRRCNMLQDSTIVQLLFVPSVSILYCRVYSYRGRLIVHAYGRGEIHFHEYHYQNGSIGNSILHAQVTSAECADGRIPRSTDSNGTTQAKPFKT